jgi:hypothetical protein
MRTKFDIYVFIKTAVSFIQQSLELRERRHVIRLIFKGNFFHVELFVCMIEL